MAKRSEHSPEELKALILNAAELIVSEEGFTSLNVRRIAREIGYTVGSIYMVFENMADLIMQINARTLDNLADSLIFVSDDKNQQYFELWAMNYLSFALQHFNQWSYALKYSLPATLGLETQAWYMAKVDKIFLSVEAKLAQLKPAQTEKEVKYAVRALLAGIQGICIFLINEKNNTSEVKEIEEIISVLVRNFLRGWLIDSNEISSI